MLEHGTKRKKGLTIRYCMKSVKYETVESLNCL